MPATLVYSLSDIVEIDATGSNGALSLVQTEGTTGLMFPKRSEYIRLSYLSNWCSLVELSETWITGSRKLPIGSVELT